MKYIYESPDNGKTVTRRPFGADDSKRETIHQETFPADIEPVLTFEERNFLLENAKKLNFKLCKFCGLPFPFIKGSVNSLLKVVVVSDNVHALICEECFIREFKDFSNDDWNLLQW